MSNPFSLLGSRVGVGVGWCDPEGRGEVGVAGAWE